MCYMAYKRDAQKDIALATAFVEGCPLWLYLVNIVVGVFVYSPLALAALFSGGWTADVFSVGLSDNRLLPLRLLCYAVMMCFAKDFSHPLSTILWLHHGFSVFSLLVIMQLPCGGLHLGLGLYVLEIGSVVYNIWCVDAFMQRFGFWPSEKVVDWAYYILHTLSNVGGLAIGLRALWLCPSPSLYAVSFVALIMLYVRQDMCFNAATGSTPKPQPYDPLQNKTS